MTIYIASSWKNVHAVEMLTEFLRQNNHAVNSFVEFETPFKDMPFNEWIKSEGADLCFAYDTNSAMTADMVIYLAPSGKDAFAEVAMAYTKNIPIIGLWAKGEDEGICHRMITKWADDYKDAIKIVNEYHAHINHINKTEEFKGFM